MKTRTATLIHLVISLLTTEFAVYVNKNGKKNRTLDVNMPQRLNTLGFQLKVKNFLSCHSVESSCVLSYSVWLALVWSGQKRHDGAPWRSSVGMTSLQNTFYSLGNSRGVARYGRCIQRDCCADPKCCMQHLLGDWPSQCYFTQIFLPRSKWRACGSGDMSPLKCIGLN